MPEQAYTFQVAMPNGNEGGTPSCEHITLWFNLKVCWLWTLDTDPPPKTHPVYGATLATNQDKNSKGN